MFIKPLAIPEHILCAQALDSRTPATHPSKETFSNRAANLLSGYKGEKSMKYHLQFLPADDFFILHYVRLPNQNGYFQLDFLILSRWFHLIIEVKNIYDNVNFDDLGQVYRTIDGSVQVFGNPIEQINMQYRRLLNWLRKHDFPPVPIEKIVVYSRDDTYLRNITNDKVISDIVMHRDKIISKINFFMNKYQSPSLSETRLTDLSWQLLEEHEPEEGDGMDQFNIGYTDLIKGVICPACVAVPMHWKSGKWNCLSCGCTSKTAHRPTLADYALLVGEYINNRQARDFLRVKSIHTAKRLIQQERFQQFGKTSGRRYKIDVDKLLNAKMYDEFAKVHTKSAKVHSKSDKVHN
ncbi:nuclease-related domain-containing protein [Lentibacillus sp.]|uniref:nuclease-related domain-containing protein n=1 Tax=Lentibacillus sp. TaxID=1925746 RepID=UPI002B4B6118|nr:nuclease-related domain-containing protein [Lentibacillus sp.]HLS08768.1 nuclease-related domain-containing protein [Lentibacillus sp.]